MKKTKESPCVFGTIPGKDVYQVSYEITNKCNLQCKHCCNDSGIERYIGEELEKTIEFIDDLANNNTRFMYISGGEPLLYPSIGTILEHIHAKGIEIGLATNATPDLNEFLPILKKAVTGGVFVSLDHYIAEKHDKFRGVPGMFEKTINGIKQMIKKDIPVRISVNIWDGNKDELEGIIKFVRELGVFRVHFSMLIKVGRSKDNKDIFINPEEYKHIVDKVESLRKKYEKTGFMVSMRRNLPLGKDCDICWAGKKIIHADSKQKIYPCSWLSKIDITPSLGKQRNKQGDMKNILAEMNKFEVVVGKRIKHFGFSGCPAIGYLNSGNIFGEDNLNELLK